MAQVVEGLFSTQEAPCSIPRTAYTECGGGHLQSQHQGNGGRKNRSSRSFLS